MNDRAKNINVVESDFLMHHEFTIDKPVGDIWPHMLNLGGWMPTHDLVTVAGKSGEVGELIKVYGAGSDIAGFYLKVIKCEPCESLILKMMPLDSHECDLIENDADFFRDILGYENFRLVESAGSTTLIFQSTAVFRVVGKPRSEVDNWVESAAAGATTRWRTVYEPALRQLVSGGES